MQSSTSISTHFARGSPKTPQALPALWPSVGNTTSKDARCKVLRRDGNTPSKDTRCKVLRRVGIVSSKDACCNILRKGHHECEIFLSRGYEKEESNFKWKTCRKNPEHETFIAVKDFRKEYLPKLEFTKESFYLNTAIDLTVRLRVRWTSPERQDSDELSECRGTTAQRLGTGFVYFVKGPILTDYDQGDRRIIKKSWKILIKTAQHVVYDTKEAQNTQVDFFYDDKFCDEDGRMKSIYGEGVIETDPTSDSCVMLCNTTDEVLAERVRSALYYWVHEPSDLHLKPISDRELKTKGLFDIETVPPCDRDRDIALIISHPHGQPKQISIGEMRYQFEDGPLVKYNTATCPGSSGALVLVIDRNLHKSCYDWSCMPVHHGSSTSIFSETDEQLNHAYKNTLILKYLKLLTTISKSKAQQLPGRQVQSGTLM
ncbi:hypothetical protein ElyMa_002879200 [Elysia marginata]|uniref:Peptidase S1 domain-containing protein n=1 Tax=Elysia marginata TaxID=1093978 RepID=A0AAV4I2Z4_9GAST|nr:hypothetical protein ElyMa_002879200 [Elysia marginata]